MSPPPIRVVFLFPDSSEVRHMRKAPKRGRYVRSPEGLVWEVADVLVSGRDTYTVTVVAPSDLIGEWIYLVVDEVRQAVKGRARERDSHGDLAADLLQHAKDAVSSDASTSSSTRHRDGSRSEGKT